MLDTDSDPTIYIQNDSSGKNKESEWLPTLKDTFHLILRTYHAQHPNLSSRSGFHQL
jgi:hypothetical protein